ncbi:hypothetical protein SVAN01_05574 [Stagonosporopsis vannaccii]|nr:hypothetical protein SVAN01_05574 [Stagonosporopsis vannaccii]
MVNQRATDVADFTTPIAPTVKRKRRASCLGEQERRERKRAIDREAQRSLREKTKTHIAELERTIQILRDQDRNGATANLLSEIDSLRAENERLRDIIDSVKHVLGTDTAPRTNAAPEAPATNGGGGMMASPASSSNEPYRSVGHRSPKARTVTFVEDSKPSLPTPTDLPTSFDYSEHRGSTRSVDLDGMNLMTADALTPPTLDLDLDTEPIEEVLPTDAMIEVRKTPVDIHDWENNSATASWGPLMQEFFGDNWRCPSPTVLHIGAPDSMSSSIPMTVCPLWRRSNEVYETIHNARLPTTGAQSLAPYWKKLPRAAEAGLLYLAMTEGWENISSEWMQSPALIILKQMDEFLFCNLNKMERLVTAYKSFKLLKYYLNSTAEQLAQVPKWLRPSISQSSIAHPIAVDFFAWPTLRNRLLTEHSSIFRTSMLSRMFQRHFKFDWPYAVEDAFFFDETTGYHRPSPLFERYHGDLKYWKLDEGFYDEYPQLRSDIDGDRRTFTKDVGA